MTQGRTVEIGLRQKRKRMASAIIKKGFGMYKTFVSTEDLFHNLYPYLVLHKNQIIGLYPKSVVKPLHKFNGHRDNIPMLSFLKQLCLFHHNIIYTKRTTEIANLLLFFVVVLSEFLLAGNTIVFTLPIFLSEDI